MSLAIIQTGGKQYVVTEGQNLKIEKLAIPENGEIVFDEVLLVSDDKTTKVGAPFVTGAKVEAKHVKEGRYAKVITNKFRNKVRYRRTIGHRQPFTQIEIKKIK